MGVRGWRGGSYPALMTGGRLSVTTPVGDTRYVTRSSRRWSGRPSNRTAGDSELLERACTGRNWTTPGDSGRLVFLEVSHQGSYERERMINLWSNQFSLIQMNYSTLDHHRYSSSLFKVKAWPDRIGQ